MKIEPADIVILQKWSLDSHEATIPRRQQPVHHPHTGLQLLGERPRSDQANMVSQYGRYTCSTGTTNIVTIGRHSNYQMQRNMEQDVTWIG